MNHQLQTNTSYKNQKTWGLIITLIIILIMAFVFRINSPHIIPLYILWMFGGGLTLWNIIKTINTTYTYLEDFQSLYHTNQHLISNISLSKPIFDSYGFRIATLRFEYNNMTYECNITNEDDYTNLIAQIHNNK